MYFDASDVGISTSDLEDFAVHGDGSILMSFSSAINVPGLIGGPDGTLIDDSDIVLFTPDLHRRHDDRGSVQLLLRRLRRRPRDHLERPRRHPRAPGRHPLCSPPPAQRACPGPSPRAPTKTSSSSRHHPTAPPPPVRGASHFDGSDVGLTSGNDDLDAIAVDNGDLLYSTSGDNTVPLTKTRTSTASPAPTAPPPAAPPSSARPRRARHRHLQRPRRPPHRPLRLLSHAGPWRSASRPGCSSWRRWASRRSA